MRRYELHPPHLISVSTLPCQSWNGKNVILQWDLPKKIASNILYVLHQNGHVDYEIWGVMQQCMYRTKICDIYDLQKCLTQTWVDFEHRTSLRLWLTSDATVWDHECVLVADTLNTCCMLNYCLFVLCGSSEHFWNCQCNLVHLTAVSKLTLKDEFIFTCIFGVST